MTKVVLHMVGVFVKKHIHGEALIRLQVILPHM